MSSTSPRSGSYGVRVNSVVRLLAPAFAAALLLAGCSASPGGGGDTPSPSSAPETPTESPTPTPTGSATADPDAPADQCPDAALKVTVENSDAGAGSVFYSIVFTNTGSSECSLRGFPGVSVVGKGNGTQLGEAAQRQPGATPTDVKLGPGGTAVATLQSVNIGDDGGPLGDACPTEAADGWRIYPPHSFEAVFVQAQGLTACTGTTPWLTVDVVKAP